MEAVDERPLSISFILGSDKASRKAFVKFSKHDLVAQCMLKLRGKELGGRKVTLTEQSSKKHNPRLETSTWIRISNVDLDLTQQSIADHLRKHSKITGRPKTISLRRDVSDEAQKQTVYVELETKEDALLAVANVCMTELEGKRCWVERVTSQGRKETLRGKTEKVILRNLDKNVEYHQVRDLCAEYGRIQHIYLRAGTAIVDMKSTQSAEKLFDGLNGVKVGGLVIRTCFSQPFRGGGRGRGRGYGRGRGRGRFETSFSGHSKMNGKHSHFGRGRGRGRGRRGIKSW